MILSLHIECGFQSDGPLDRDTLNDIAKQYFTQFILQHKEMLWCDVSIYDRAMNNIGACRNPPSLPHYTKICKNCIYCDSIYDDDHILFCRNAESDKNEITPSDSCKRWQFNEEVYYK